MATGTAVDVVMPQMGVSVSEGTITKWLKSLGEAVAADEPLLEISTDKVDTEVPSPASGVLAEIFAQEGETVPVGTRIAVVSSGTAAPAEVAPPPPVEEPEPEPVHAPHYAPLEPAAEAAPPPLPDADDRPAGARFVSPVVARIAAEHGVDVAQIAGTGRGGRVTKTDILDFIEARGIGPAAPAPPEPVPAPAPAPVLQPAPAPAPLSAAGEGLEPMTPMRRGIAEHMRRSLDTSAHVTTVFEIDMSKVVALRQRLRPELEERHGVKLTYLPFIARATVDTLATWPWLNGEIRGDQIVTRHFVNLGVAVALEGGKGLIVPVVKNAEEKNLLGLARAINDLADRARTKRLLPDDVQGGTFTITNPGGWGAIVGTPIISQPQVGILDVEAIVKRVVVVEDADGNDTIAIRPMMNLCLSYDHRLVDGAYAAQFMRDLRIALETWEESSY